VKPTAHLSAWEEDWGKEVADQKGIHAAGVCKRHVPQVGPLSVDHLSLLGQERKCRVSGQLKGLLN
jgi:hypothetical protein